MSIANEMERMQTAKDNLKIALEFQGQPVSQSDMIDDLPEKVANIPALEIPIATEVTNGYVYTQGWVYEYLDPPMNYANLYRVKAGHTYCITLGETVGTRFRVVNVATDPRECTSGTLPPIDVAYNFGKDAPNPYQPMAVSFTDPTDDTLINKSAPIFYCTQDSYLVIQVDNVGTTGIKTYVFDLDTPVAINGGENVNND